MNKNCPVLLNAIYSKDIYRSSFETLKCIHIFCGLEGEGMNIRSLHQPHYMSEESDYQSVLASSFMIYCKALYCHLVFLAFANSKGSQLSNIFLCWTIIFWSNSQQQLFSTDNNVICFELWYLKCITTGCLYKICSMVVSKLINVFITLVLFTLTAF